MKNISPQLHNSSPTLGILKDLVILHLSGKKSKVFYIHQFGKYGSNR